ncbi:MAG: lytic murein transglycosylase [Alphaproteobacteria bacterium]|nr:lytic murein transglycosylase [Alphaproteobacteria bacterium]
MPGRIAGLVLAFMALPPLAAHAEDLASFLARFEAQAVDAGISRDLYREVTDGLAPDPRVPDLVVSQPEFTTPIWTYLDARVSDVRIAAGRKAVDKNRPLLDAVGEAFGVDPFVLAAIWGVESDFGAILGNAKLIRPILPSLATLATQHRGRWQEDEAELIAALRLIQDHGWTGQTLVGSWAGAVGHTQLIVSAILAHGTDGDGDGRVDPHASLADALATTAMFLKGLGYRTGSDWGYEVTVPQDFDLLLASRETLRPVRFFAERGVARVAGRQFRDPDEEVFLYLPAGKDGPAFLMTGNYLVLKGYNFSDSYALSVAHLADRLKGAGPFVAEWPSEAKLPSLKQREAIQEALATLGYYDGAVDGRIGPITQRAYALFQADNDLPADGFITSVSAEVLAAALP